MTGVGRPSEIDGSGNIIEKKVVNVNIPVKLIKFLKEKEINRSQLFTECVRKLYNDEICPKCFGADGIAKGACGIQCYDCKIWIKMFNCENCDTQYQPHYNMFQQDGDKLGCWDCMGKPELRE
jgi:hypothetical protein